MAGLRVPKGLRHLAQGWRPAPTLRTASPNLIYPERVAPCLLSLCRTLNHRRNPQPSTTNPQLNLGEQTARPCILSVQKPGAIELHRVLVLLRIAKDRGATGGIRKSQQGHPIARRQKFLNQVTGAWLTRKIELLRAVRQTIPHRQTTGNKKGFSGPQAEAVH